MAAFLAPLLLVLIGLGGLVVIVGRRMRDLRGELASVPAFLHAPSEADAVWLASLRSRLVQASVAVARVVVQVARRAGQLTARLLQRPPVTIRVPRLADQAASFRRTLQKGVARPALRFRERLRRSVSPASSGLKPAGGASVVLPEHPSDRPPTGWGDDELDRAAAPAGTPDAAPGRPLDDLLQELVPAHEEAQETGGPARSGFAAGDAGGPASVTSGAPEPPPVASRPEGVVAETLTAPAAAARAEGAVAPVLEPHVEETTWRRRKVVGRVRPLGQTKRREAVARPRRRPPEKHAAAPEPAEDTEALGTLRDVPALLKKGELSRAEGILVDNLAANPRNFSAYRLLGLLYMQREDFPQAREVLEEALKREVGEATLYGPLGRTYFALGQYSLALKMYQLAHDADEQNLDYLEQILLIASRMDRRPLVKVTAEKILAVQPNHAEAKKHLAKVAVGK